MICEHILMCSNKEQENCARKALCKETSGKQKQLVCRDMRSKKEYRLVNDRDINVDKYHVDGGVYYRENHTVKCDYMLVIHAAKTKCVFVELKGRDIRHGVQQLILTIKHLGRQLQGCVFYARLVQGAG